MMASTKHKAGVVGGGTYVGEHWIYPYLYDPEINVARLHLWIRGWHPGFDRDDPPARAFMACNFVHRAIDIWSSFLTRGINISTLASGILKFIALRKVYGLETVKYSR
jgi:hypothetical protein